MICLTFGLNKGELHRGNFDATPLLLEHPPWLHPTGFPGVCFRGETDRRQAGGENEEMKCKLSGPPKTKKKENSLALLSIMLFILLQN